MSTQHASDRRTVMVLGTGGTIAGTAPAGSPAERYRAAQLAVEQLLAPLKPQLRAALGTDLPELEAVEVARIDSRSMSHAVWQRLQAELERGLGRPDVVGQVITHGTDTVEETGMFLSGVLRARRPVVLTAGMRPATSEGSDGPSHLLQAIALACDPRAAGVLMAFGGRAWPAQAVRKLHPFRLEAFSGGDCSPVALWQAGAWVWPGQGRDTAAAAAHLDFDAAGPPVSLPSDVGRWPVVEIVHSHAGAGSLGLQALLGLRRADGSAAVDGVVISATGNGSIHDGIHQALEEAVRQGRLARRQVLVASRCIGSSVVGEPEHGWPVAAHLTPAQARVALMLQLADLRPPATPSPAAVR